MLDMTTLNKLHELRLHAMAENYRRQMEDPAFGSLGFEERFGMMVDSEWARRRSTRVENLIPGFPATPNENAGLASINQAAIEL